MSINKEALKSFRASEGIRYLKHYCSITNSELAKALGISNTSLHSILKYKAKVKLDVVNLFDFIVDNGLPVKACSDIFRNGYTTDKSLALPDPTSFKTPSHFQGDTRSSGLVGSAIKKIFENHFTEKEYIQFFENLNVDPAFFIHPDSGRTTLDFPSLAFSTLISKGKINKYNLNEVVNTYTDFFNLIIQKLFSNSLLDDIDDFLTFAPQIDKNLIYKLDERKGKTSIVTVEAEKGSHAEWVYKNRPEVAQLISKFLPSSMEKSTSCQYQIETFRPLVNYGDERVKAIYTVTENE